MPSAARSPAFPNRPVASELVDRERRRDPRSLVSHARRAVPHQARDGLRRRALWLTLGSANLTRRNLADYNLEANLAIDLHARLAARALQALEYFDTLWSNRAPLGIEYTADFGVYADPAQSHYWLYRFMESTGLSTF